MYLIAECEKAMELARTLTRGVYQEALLGGREAWSGATLQGRAREYGGRYKRSRENLLARMEANGINFRFDRVGTGKRIVLIVEGLSAHGEAMTALQRAEDALADARKVA